MIGTNLAIVGASLAALLLIALFTGPREWLASIKQRPGLAFFLVVALASTFLGGSREAGASASMIDPLRLTRMVVLICLFFWSLNSILKHGASLRMAGTGAKLMLTYGLFAMFSATYSVDPLLTLWKGFEVVALVLVIISVSVNIRALEDVQWLLNVLFLMLLFVILSILMGAIIAPDVAFRALMEGGNPQIMGDSMAPGIPILRGVMPEINPSAASGLAGFVVVGALIPLLNKGKQARIGLIIVVCTAILTIILAHSRTGIFALAAAVTAILIIKRYTLYAVLLGLPIGVILAFTTVKDAITSYIYRGQTEEQFTSMSGRTEFWEVVIDKFTDSPFIGHGYYASHRILFGVSGVDNTYFSVILGVGIIGLIIFVSALVVGLAQLLRSWPKKTSSTLYRTLWLQILGVSVIIFVRSLTGTSFETFYNLLFVYMVLQISIFALNRISDSDSSKSANFKESKDSHLDYSVEPRILRRRKQIT